jgi:hypothetical protein
MPDPPPRRQTSKQARKQIYHMDGGAVHGKLSIPTADLYETHKQKIKRPSSGQCSYYSCKKLCCQVMMLLLLLHGSFNMESSH